MDALPAVGVDGWRREVREEIHGGDSERDG